MQGSDRVQTMGLQRFFYAAENGRRISYVLRNPASTKEATFCFLHATGFHALVWLEVIANLPPTAGVLALDAAGHGCSDVPNDHASWQQVAHDAQLVMQRIQWQHAVVIGHSMGGAAAMMLAAQYPDSVSRLVLLDPTIFPDGLRLVMRTWYACTGKHFSDFVKKRKNRYVGVQDMIDRFQQKPVFALWHDHVLADYCNYGLLQATETSDYALRCSPPIEAAYYRSGMFVYPGDWSAMQQPITLVYAMRSSSWFFSGFQYSPTDPRLAQRVQAPINVVHADDLTHFIPMQAPERTAAWIKDALEVSD